MMRKRKTTQKLKDSFGKPKEDDFHFDLIDKYFRNKEHADAFQVLSDKTCNDLDFEELFMLIDRTYSRTGQQYLYDRLRTIPNDSDKIGLSEKLIQKLSDNADFRVNTQLQLNKLNSENAYYISALFQEKHEKPPKWFFIIRVLSFTSLLSLVLLPVNPQMLFV